MAHRRIKVMLALVLLIASTTIGAAEPGGNGDGLRNMQCGGACHGDASQNASSSLSLSIQYASQVWVGQPTEVTVIVSGLGEVHDHELLGVFLLSSTNANGDTPLSDGWEILSDGHGGTGNYVELTSIAGSDSIEHTWVLRTEDLGPKNMYASIHHGDSAGPSQGQPFFGISEGYEVEVAPLPENAPRLSAAFDPASTREVGVAIQVSIQTEHTQTVNVEWRAEDGAMMEATVNTTGDNEWVFTLPASLKPSSVQWRATLIGEGPEQTTPWFTMVAQTAPEEADSGPIYLQGLAMALLLFGAIIALQKPQRREEDTTKVYDNTAHIESTQSTDQEDAPAPLPEGGLPPGWTDEQWAWYGHEYLAGTYGGDQQ